LDFNGHLAQKPQDVFPHSPKDAGIQNGLAQDLSWDFSIALPELVHHPPASHSLTVDLPITLSAHPKLKVRGDQFMRVVFHQNIK